MLVDLKDLIPKGLSRKLEAILVKGETIEVQLKGVWKEVLVCTDRRVIIIKSGFMTGHFFGSNVFQVPYANVAGCDVNFHLLTGYFELSTGGMQNTQKSYWGGSSAKSPNCVTLNTRVKPERFRQACSFIMERVLQIRQPVVSVSATPVQENASESLERIWKLKNDGAITQEEYETMKQRLVAG